MKKKITKSMIFMLTICLIFSYITPLIANATTFKTNVQTSCDAIELINLDTDTVVYKKNENKRRAPASTTKIMTFIIVSEQIKDLDNTKITVNKEVVDRLLGTGSSLSGIKEGDILTAFQLLNCMMIPSGNDAAMVLADYVGKGDISKFVDLMNKKAKELGCTNTHFENPHGLHDPNHYTTAHDLYKITKYAMGLPHFTEITSQTRYTYKPSGGPNAENNRTLCTTNLLIDKNALGGKYYYIYARGIKTGHHDEAGYCLVSTATADGYSYMCVALGGPEDSKRAEMVDSKNLYKWALTNLELKNVLRKDDPVGEANLQYAWNKDKLLLVAEKDYAAILPKNVSAQSVIIEKNIPEKIEAPIKKGQKVGTATLSYANQKIATVNLVASESVEHSELVHSTETIKSIFSSGWFIAIAIIIIILLIIYIILALIYNRKKRNLKRVKKYRKM